MPKERPLIRWRTWPKDFNNNFKEMNDVYQRFNSVKAKSTSSDNLIILPNINNGLNNVELQIVRVDPLIDFFDLNNNLIDDLANGLDNVNVEVMRLYQPDWKFFLCFSIITISIVWFSRDKFYLLFKDFKNWFSIFKYQNKTNINMNNQILNNDNQILNTDNQNVIDVKDSIVKSNKGKITFEFGKRILKDNYYCSPILLPILGYIAFILKNK